jgi:hypothetical protein
VHYIARGPIMMVRRPCVRCVASSEDLDGLSLVNDCATNTQTYWQISDIFYRRMVSHSLVLVFFCINSTDFWIYKSRSLALTSLTEVNRIKLADRGFVPRLGPQNDPRLWFNNNWVCFQQKSTFSSWWEQENKQ